MKKKYFYVMLLISSLAFPSVVMAQQDVPARNRNNPRNRDATSTSTSKTPAPFKIAHVGDDTVRTLSNLRPGAKILVDLGASVESLQANPAAFRALQKWVEAGGVMAVYSDAATLFGFDLQTARTGNPQQGGQLFGRAVGAIPFGSEPLLWNIPAASPATGDDDAAADNLPLLDEAPRRRRRNRLSVDDPTTFGQMTVFYDMEEGDSLLASHPSAVPLLRVTDLAQPQTQLFAAAIACYGNGWIIFMPRHVEAGRAQSEQFLYNLSALAANPPIPISVSALTETAESLFGNTPNYTPLLTELQSRLAGKATPNDAPTAETGDDNDDAAPNGTEDGVDETTTITPAAASTDTTRLMPAALPVSRGLAVAMFNAIKAASSASPPANARERVASVVALWMLRASIQHVTPPTDDVDAQEGTQADEKATQWLNEATELAPEAREVLFWQGVFHAQIAAHPVLPSPQRAAAFAAAADAWKRAASATPLLTIPTAAPLPVATDDDNAGDDDDDTDAATAAPVRPPLGEGFGDPTPALLNEWAKQAQKAATITAVEPPVTQVVSGVILRHVPNDPTLRLALPTINKLQSMAGQFGWVAPQEEILIFPNESALTVYANLLGPLEPDETPLASAFGRYGRVLGNRILMVSQPSQPIILPGTPPRIIQAGTAAAAIIGRLHGELLFNALDEGGNPTPGWMNLGLSALAGKAVTTEGDTGPQGTQLLLQAGAANQLLVPTDFDQRRGNDNQSGLAETQAESLMTYFYQQFGPGAVMETAQRIGSGQEVDEALDATTGMTEAEFFSSWFASLQGNGDMP